jgi:membrane protein YqaA with SNARE-associated domain
MLDSTITWVLGVLAISKIGLITVLIVSFISATLLPMGSEPVVFAVIKANPDLFWPCILVATIGNTLGGMLNYGMAYGAKNILAKERDTIWFSWLKKYGAKSMLFAWLPVIGDPLCALGGWLKLPFWPCVFYMMIGKFLRYVVMTMALMQIPENFWHQLAVYFM